MMEKIQIILVDDHRIVRDGIKSILNSTNSIEVIGEASNYEELTLILKEKIPDIIMLDISLPGLSGIEITQILKEEYPGIKVIILSMYTDDDFIYNALKAGAKSYLPKNTNRQELLEAVELVYRGEEYFNEFISNIILKSYIKKAKADSSDNDKQTLLTRREMEVLSLFAEGLSNQEIAGRLFISIRTVESHKNHIMQKFKLKSVVDLVKYAIKSGIIKI